MSNINSHDHIGYIAKGAAARAATIFDSRVLELLKQNGLEDLFQDAINGLDREALARKGYMLIHEPVTETSEDSIKTTITHKVTLAKIIDTTAFRMDFSVDLSAIKMKES